MHQILLIAVGLIVGLMVGLTGVGGGALLVPILVLLLHVPAIVAVGTGALFVAVTKIGAAWSYHQRGLVDMRLVLRMAVGSIPGAALGVGGLGLIRAHMGDGVNAFLKVFIGIVLILTPALAFLQEYLKKTGKKSLREHLPRWITPSRGATAVGFVGGFLVGMTSMGSGSVIMTLLVLFYSRPLTTLVGTDIAHAVILATVARPSGAGHGRFSIVGGTSTGFDSGSLVCSAHLHFDPDRLVTYRIVFPNCGSWHIDALVAVRTAEIEAE